MLSLHCLTLIVYMEARNQSEKTQIEVASFAIERAEQDNLSICASMKKPKLYSWLWDGTYTPIDKEHFEKKTKPLAKLELSRKKRTLTGYHHFTNCKVKPFPGKVYKSGDICFYKGDLK